MARRGPDGSIILTTSVDTSGMEKGTSDIKSIANKTGQAFKSLGSAVSKALAQGDIKTAQLANNFQKATAEVEKQTEKVNELKNRLAQLKSGEITVKDSGVTKLQKNFEKATAEADGLSNKIAELSKRQNELIRSSDTIPMPTSSNGLLEKQVQGYGTIEGYDKLFPTGTVEQVAELEAELNKLGEELEKINSKATQSGEALKKAIGLATQSEIDKTKSKLKEAEGKLGALSAKAEIAGQKLGNITSKKNIGTISQVSSGLGKMGMKISQLAKGALIFSAITQGLTILRKEIANVIMSDEGFRSSLNQLQAALWTAFAPIYNYIVPALKTLVNWITTAITTITKFVASLFGKSYSAMVDNGEKLQKQADAYEAIGSGGSNAAKGMKKATDEAKKQLAAFDDLNILTENKANADKGTDSGGGVSTGGDMSGAFDGLKSSNMTGEVTTALAEIGREVGKSLAAVGLLLLFNGAIGWGVGFIAMGAIVYGVSTAALSEKLNLGSYQQELQTLSDALSGLLMALGVILIFLGSTPLGIGCIAAGAIVFGIKQTEGNEDEFDENKPLQKLQTILQGAGAALAAIGLILIFLGQVPIGLGFLIMGAKIFGVTSQQLKENEITTKISLFLTDNQNLIVGVSLALLVLGLILFACGVVNPQSLGLLLAGVVGLATMEQITGDSVSKLITNWLEENSGLVVGVSTALLVLGILLCLCGTVSPLSIGLIVAGVVGLATEITLNFDEITTKISKFIDDNGALIIGVGTALVLLGVILLCCGLIPLGLGCLAAGGATLAEAIKVNKDEIVNILKEVWKKVEDFWNENIAEWFTKEKWIELAGKVGEGLENGFKAAINGVIAIVEAGINWIVDMMNSISFEVPDWVPGVGGSTFGFNIDRVDVPRLATGGIVPYATTALIGEAGKEAVLPLENNTEWMDMLADRILERNGGTGGNTEVILEIDGREFGRAVVEQGNKENRRIGTRLVIV